MADTPLQTEDQTKVRYGFWVVMFGLTIVLGVYYIAVNKWQTAADVTAGVSSVTGIIGTIVGAFFGVQVGSAGKEKAEMERNMAEDKALKLASALHPDVAARVLNINE